LLDLLVLALLVLALLVLDGLDLLVPELPIVARGNEEQEQRRGAHGHAGSSSSFPSGFSPGRTMR
jgi:hypothetical protein